MKKVGLKILFILIFLLGFGTISSYASINVSSKTVNSGEKVTISVSSNQSLGAYTVSIADNGGLTFVTSTGQEGSGKTVISGSSTSGVTSLATFTFQTPSVTSNKTYQVKISAKGMETPDMQAVQNSTATATITVKAPNSGASEEKPTENAGNSSSSSSTSNNSSSANNKKSSNANLSNLIVSPVDFTGFKASKTSGYSVTVDNNVTEVKITTKTQDSKAKVVVSGNKNLKVGKNTVKVLVTAEDGTQKTYTVNVTKKEKKDENSNKNEENTVTTVRNTIPENKIEENDIANETVLANADASTLGLTSLTLVGITSNDITVEPNISPEFDTSIYSYTANVTSDIESIKIDAIANKENVEIEVMGNENLVIGENIITVLVKTEDGTEQQTYQIVVNKTEENLDLTHNSNLVKYIIIGAGVVIIQIAIIIAIINIVRNRRKRLEGAVTLIEDDKPKVNEKKEDNKDYFKKSYLDMYNQNDDYKKDSFNGKKNGKRFK